MGIVCFRNKEAPAPRRHRTPCTSASQIPVETPARSLGWGGLELDLDPLFVLPFVFYGEKNLP